MMIALKSIVLVMCYLMFAVLQIGCEHGENPVSKSILGKQTLVELKTAAQNGDLDAQMELGLQFLNGKNLMIDEAEAFRWFRMAAYPGDPEAENQIGRMYSKGKGVAISSTEALNWIRLAARKGLAKAQFNLGVLYQRNIPLVVDCPTQITVQKAYAKAREWYQKAIAQGHREALYNFSVLEKSSNTFTQSYDDMSCTEDELIERAALTEFTGRIYHSKGDLAEAEKHYRKSLEVFSSFGVNGGIANQYKNLTFVYFERVDQAKACEMARLSVSYYEQAQNNEMKSEAESWFRKHC